MQTSAANESACIFLHNVVAMSFDGFLACAKFSIALFVKPPGNA
jgi:hypothetical protein